jgi:TRAP-type C4-dicarboxylate transport system substrate-binding protein
MKRLSIILVVSILVLSVSVNSFAVGKYHWKIGHVRPEETAVDKDTKWLVEKINQDSGGRITFDIYPANQLGDYRVVQERVSFGDVEMYIGPFGTETDKRLNLPATPYLVKNWIEAKKVFAHDSMMIKKMGEYLEQQDIKILGGWPVYFGGIVLMKEASSPGDPNVSKDMKIRVPPIKSFEVTAQALGFMATPIPWAEVFTALQTGIVDGAIGGGAEGYYANFRDLVKYYLAVNDHFEYWFIYMNMSLWNKLSDEDKAIVQNAVAALELKRFEEGEADEQFNMKRLEEHGITIVTFSDEELAQMTEKTKKEAWPILRKDIGAEAFDEIVSSVQ